MTCDNEAPPPYAPERGDVVTLKSDPGVRYVVLGFFVSVPTYYLVRHVDQQFRTELTVRRCEIASVEKCRDTPEVLRNGTAHPVKPDQHDAAPPIDWAEAQRK